MDGPSALLSSLPPVMATSHLDFDDRPDQVTKFCEEQLQDLRESLAPLVEQDNLAMMNADLMNAHRLHETDLFKTQGSYQETQQKDANILILVKYPEFTSIQSCRYSSFQTGKVRLTLEQLQGTGSELLVGLLADEKHQRRAKKAAAPLGDGVTHVIDLSPTTDEDDFTIALQRLTITNGIKLWYRSMAFGVSPLAVSGHDDVCCCILPVDEQYPLPQPPESVKNPGRDGEVCLFDAKEWPIDEHYNIDDFCQTRWAANTQRLFRSIAQPAGQKDLLIDSAPRMWTLVGLFSKLEMTNYDLLRDEVTAWFNAERNYLFVELCPEETLRIGLTLKIPLLAEPAFRILVNERALEVAGGQPRFQPMKTIFGRCCSDFSGTDDTESISRIVEYAGTAMADRYKAALDQIHSDDFLDMLNVPEWMGLRALDEIIPKASPTDLLLPVRFHYDQMMNKARTAVRKAIDKIFDNGGADLPEKIIHDSFLGKSWQAKTSDCLDSENVDAKRTYSVPKRELRSTQSFNRVWHSLNQHQRALCPLYWQSFRNVTQKDMIDTFFDDDIAIEFGLQFAKAKGDGQLMPGSSNIDLAMDLSGYFGNLFRHVVEGLRAYVEPLVDRDVTDFFHTITPHLLLTLDDNEMNFLRLADDETRFQADVPEAEMGPVGPGPAFHTGHTVASVSDLDVENLAVVSEDGTSTFIGSAVAQDGISSIFRHRNRVLVQSSEPSVASEQFTDGDMSVEYADAEYAIPAEHQSRGQILADVVDETESDDALASDDNLDDPDVEDESDNTVDGDDSDQLDGEGDFDMVFTNDCR